MELLGVFWKASHKRTIPSKFCWNWNGGFKDFSTSYTNSCRHWHITDLTRRVSPAKQEVLILPEHLRSPLVFCGVRVARFLLLCVVVCTLLSLFVWPLCFLSLDLRLLITPVVSSNFSFGHCVFCPSIYVFWLSLSWYICIFKLFQQKEYNIWWATVYRENISKLKNMRLIHLLVNNEICLK